MRRILLSLMGIVLTLALLGGGIYALFSDTETSVDNTFTAGTLNLQVGAQDPCVETIAVSGLKPTDSGNAADWLITNIGSIAGRLSISVGTIVNNENTRSEVETAAGDTTDDQGELGSRLRVAFWMDVDRNGTWSSGDYYLGSDGNAVSWVSGTTLPPAAYDILNNYGGREWTNVQTVSGNLDAGRFRVEYSFPDGGSNDNQAQGDSCVFNIVFFLTQA